MRKFEVEVNVTMKNYFTVYAENEEEAADKAKQAMDDILGYGISYETETDEAKFMGGSDSITIGEVAEYKEDEEACCICGVGKANNNAAPYAEGYCCDVCNAALVIPARIEEIFKNRGAKQESK